MYELIVSRLYRLHCVAAALLSSKTEASFMSVFQPFVSARLPPVKTASSEPAPAPRVALSPQFLRVTTERCLRDKYWTALGQLMRSHTLSARVVPALVATLIEHKQLVPNPRTCVSVSTYHSQSLLELCVTSVHDVPETDLIAALQFVMDAGDELLTSYVRAKEADLPVWLVVAALW